MLLFLDFSFSLELLFLLRVIKFTIDWVVIMRFRVLLINFLSFFIDLFLYFLLMIFFESVSNDIEVPSMMIQQFFGPLER